MASMILPKRRAAALTDLNTARIDRGYRLLVVMWLITLTCTIGVFVFAFMHDEYRWAKLAGLLISAQVAALAWMSNWR